MPSITETLFALGAGSRLAGVTEYCIHPAAEVAPLPRVGGTKNPDLERLLALSPDLVIANREENRERDVAALESSGVPVFVTYARSVREALDEIETLGALVATPPAVRAICDPIETALAAARARTPERRPTVLALIWKDPWMGVGEDTFAADLIRESGGRNVLAAQRGERRYPRLSLAELAELGPELILLPTEPYAFGEAERRELAALDCPAARSGRIVVFEGELLSWYGPRMARALDTFSGWIADAAESEDLPPSGGC